MHLGYAFASLLENLLISEWFSSASGPRSRYLPSRHGVNDEGLRGSSFSPCLSSSRSLMLCMQSTGNSSSSSSNSIIILRTTHKSMGSSELRTQNKTHW